MTYCLCARERGERIVTVLWVINCSRKPYEYLTDLIGIEPSLHLNSKLRYGSTMSKQLGIMRRALYRSGEGHHTKLSTENEHYIMSLIDSGDITAVECFVYISISNRDNSASGARSYAGELMAQALTLSWITAAPKCNYHRMQATAPRIEYYMRGAYNILTVILSDLLLGSHTLLCITIQPPDISARRDLVDPRVSYQEVYWQRKLLKSRILTTTRERAS